MGKDDWKKETSYWLYYVKNNIRRPVNRKEYTRLCDAKAAITYYKKRWHKTSKDFKLERWKFIEKPKTTFTYGLKPIRRRIKDLQP